MRPRSFANATGPLCAEEKFLRVAAIFYQSDRPDMKLLHVARAFGLSQRDYNRLGSIARDRHVGRQGELRAQPRDFIH